MQGAWRTARPARRTPLNPSLSQQVTSPFPRRLNRVTAAPDRTDLLAGNDAHAAGGTTCQKADFLNGAFGAVSL